MVIAKIGIDGYNHGEEEFIIDKLIEKHKSIMINVCHMNEAECNASIKKIMKKDGLHKVEISSSYYNDIHLEFHKVEFEINETDF